MSLCLYSREACLCAVQNPDTSSFLSANLSQWTPLSRLWTATVLPPFQVSPCPHAVFNFSPERNETFQRWRGGQADRQDGSRGTDGAKWRDPAKILKPASVVVPSTVGVSRTRFYHNDTHRQTQTWTHKVKTIPAA